MISPVPHKTVLVIGAGCSMPYGFPSGPSLVDRIIGSPLSFVSSDDNHSNESWVDEDARKALRSSRLASIDQFLERRQDFQNWGRTRISKIILDAERQFLAAFEKGSVPQRGSDWLSYLWSEYLACPVDEFSNHEIAFVTYNYDRLIEHSLCEAMLAMNRCDQQKVVAAVARVPFIHLHGSLGPIRQEFANAATSVLPFGARANQEMLAIVSKNWQLAWEHSAAGQEFEAAANHIATAKRVIIVGLGRAVDVLKPLLAQALKIKFQQSGVGYNKQNLPGNRVYVCCYGLKKGESDQLLAVSSTIACGMRGFGANTPVNYGPEVDALGMLREMPRLQSSIDQEL